MKTTKIFATITLFLGLFLAARFAANNKFWLYGVPGAALVFVSTNIIIREGFEQ